MDEIEYLEEYEDLILPTMSSHSNVTKSRTTNNLVSMADDEDSSSIDQDIFESLFDDHSDDESVMQKKVPAKLSQRNERGSQMSHISMDSLDLLVKDLGEPLNAQPNSSKQTLKSLPKASNTKTSQPNKVLQKAPTTAVSARATNTPTPSAGENSKVSNKSETAATSADRGSKSKSIATVRPTVQQNLPQATAKETNANTSETSTNSATLNNTSTSAQNAKMTSGAQNSSKVANPVASTSRKQISSVTSTTGGSNSKGSTLSGSKSNASTATAPKRIIERSQTTIIKPEKPQIKDPAEDPLSLENIENESDSDTDSFIYSDISADTFVSLSDVDYDERQVIELSNDSNYDRANLDKIRGSTPSPTVSDDNKSENEDASPQISSNDNEKCMEGSAFESNANTSRKFHLQRFVDSTATTSGNEEHAKPSCSNEQSMKVDNKNLNANDTLLDRIDTVLSELSETVDEEEAVEKQIDDVGLEVEVTTNIEDETKEKGVEVSGSAMTGDIDTADMTNTQPEASQEPSKSHSVDMEMEEDVENVEQQINELEVEEKPKAEKKAIEKTDNEIPEATKIAVNQTVDDDVVMQDATVTVVAEMSVTEINDVSETIEFDEVVEEFGGKGIESGENIEISKNLEMKQTEVESSPDKAEVVTDTSDLKSFTETDEQGGKSAITSNENNSKNELQSNTKNSTEKNEELEQTTQLDEEDNKQENSTEELEEKTNEMDEGNGRANDEPAEIVQENTDIDTVEKNSNLNNEDKEAETPAEEEQYLEQNKLDTKNNDGELEVNRSQIETAEERATSSKNINVTQNEKEAQLESSIKTRKMEKLEERETRSQTPLKAKKVDSKTRSRTPIKAKQADNKTRQQSTIKSKLTSNKAGNDEKKHLEKATDNCVNAVQTVKTKSKVEPQVESKERVMAITEVTKTVEQSDQEIKEVSLPSALSNKEDIEDKKEAEDIKKSTTIKEKSKLDAEKKPTSESSVSNAHVAEKSQKEVETKADSVKQKKAKDTEKKESLVEASAKDEEGISLPIGDNSKQVDESLKNPHDVTKSTLVVDKSKSDVERRPTTTLTETDTDNRPLTPRERKVAEANVVVEISETEDVKKSEATNECKSEKPKSATAKEKVTENHSNVINEENEEKPLNTKEDSKEEIINIEENTLNETSTSTKPDMRIRGLVVSLKKTDLSKVLNEKLLQNRQKVPKKSTTNPENERSSDKSQIESKEEVSEENAKRDLKDDRPANETKKDSKGERPVEKVPKDSKEEKSGNRNQTESKDEKSKTDAVVDRTKLGLKDEKSEDKEKRESKEETSVDRAKLDLRDNKAKRDLKDGKSAQKEIRESKGERSVERTKRESTKDEKSTERVKRDEGSRDRSRKGLRDEGSAERARKDAKEEKSTDRAKRDTRSDRHTDRAKRDTRNDKYTDKEKRDTREDRHSDRTKMDTRHDRHSDREKRDTKDERYSDRAKKDTKDERSTHRTKRDERYDKSTDRGKRDNKDHRSTERRDAKDDRSMDRARRDLKDDRTTDRSKRDRKHEKSADREKRDIKVEKSISKNEKPTCKDKKSDTKEEKYTDKIKRDSNDEKSADTKRESNEKSVVQLKSKEAEKDIKEPRISATENEIKSQQIKPKNQTVNKESAKMESNESTDVIVDLTGIDDGEEDMQSTSDNKSNTNKIASTSKVEHRNILKRKSIHEHAIAKHTATKKVAKDTEKHQTKLNQPDKVGEDAKKVKVENDDHAKCTDKSQDTMQAENAHKSEEKSEHKFNEENAKVDSKTKRVTRRTVPEKAVSTSKDKEVDHMAKTAEKSVESKAESQTENINKVEEDKMDDVTIVDSSNEMLEKTDEVVVESYKKTTAEVLAESKDKSVDAMVVENANRDKPVDQVIVESRDKSHTEKDKLVVESEDKTKLEVPSPPCPESLENTREERVKAKPSVANTPRTRQKKIESKTRVESTDGTKKDEAKPTARSTTNTKATLVVESTLRTRENKVEAENPVKNIEITDKTKAEETKAAAENLAKTRAKAAAEYTQISKSEDIALIESSDSAKVGEGKVTRANTAIDSAPRTRGKKVEAEILVESSDNTKAKDEAKATVESSTKTRAKAAAEVTPGKAIEAKAHIESSDITKVVEGKATRAVIHSTPRTRERKEEAEIIVESTDNTKADEGKATVESSTKTRAKAAAEVTPRKAIEAKAHIESSDITKAVEAKATRAAIHSTPRTRERKEEAEIIVESTDNTKADEPKVTVESSTKTRAKAATEGTHIKKTKEKALTESSESTKLIEGKNTRASTVDDSTSRTRGKKVEADIIVESTDNTKADEAKATVESSTKTRSKAASESTPKRKVETKALIESSDSTKVAESKAIQDPAKANAETLLEDTDNVRMLEKKAESKPFIESTNINKEHKSKTCSESSEKSKENKNETEIVSESIENILESEILVDNREKETDLESTDANKNMENDNKIEGKAQPEEEVQLIDGSTEKAAAEAVTESTTTTEITDKLHDTIAGTDSTINKVVESLDKKMETEADISEPEVITPRILRRHLKEPNIDRQNPSTTESNTNEVPKTNNPEEEQTSTTEKIAECEKEPDAEGSSETLSSLRRLTRTIAETQLLSQSPDTLQSLSAGEEEHDSSIRRSLRKRAADHSPTNTNDLIKKGAKSAYSNQTPTSGLTTIAQRLTREQLNVGRSLAATPTMSATRKRMRDVTPSKPADASYKEKSPDKKNKLEPLRKSTRRHNDDVDTSEGELDNSFAQRRVRLTANTQSSRSAPANSERGRSTPAPPKHIVGVELKPRSDHSPKPQQRPTSAATTAETHKRRYRTELELLQMKLPNKIARLNDESKTIQKTATAMQRPEPKSESSNAHSVVEAVDPLQIPVKRLRRLQAIDGIEGVNIADEPKVDEVDKKDLAPKRKSLRTGGHADAAKDEANKTPTRQQSQQPQQQQKVTDSGDATTDTSTDKPASKESSKPAEKEEIKSAVSVDKIPQPSPTKSPGSKVITFKEWLEQQKKSNGDVDKDAQLATEPRSATAQSATVTSQSASSNINEAANLETQKSKESADCTTSSEVVLSVEKELTQQADVREVREASRRKKDAAASKEKSALKDVDKQTPVQATTTTTTTTNNAPTEFKRPSLPQRSIRVTPVRHRAPTQCDSRLSLGNTQQSGGQSTLHKVDSKGKLRKLRVRINRSTVAAYFKQLDLNKEKVQAAKKVTDEKVVTPLTPANVASQLEDIAGAQKRSRQKILPTITHKRVVLKAAAPTLPQLPTLTARPTMAAATPVSSAAAVSATTTEDAPKLAGPMPKLTKVPSVLETSATKPQNESVISPITAAGHQQNGSADEPSLLTPMKSVAVTTPISTTNSRSHQQKQPSTLTAAEDLREKRASTTSSSDSNTTQRSQLIVTKTVASSLTPATLTAASATKDTQASFTPVVPKEEVVDDHQQQTQQQLSRPVAAVSAESSTTTNSLASRTLAIAAATNSALNQTSTTDTSGYYGLTPTSLDSNGTRLYSFLHPAKYNRNHGCVLLDYCCPNLDGPMPAIDPTRIHAQVQAGVRELPAYIVMTTKLITRADLEANKNVIPASIRQKVEKITADASNASANQSAIAGVSGTPNVSLSIPTTLQITPAPKATLTPSISALQRHLPPTTIITPKLVAPTSTQVLSSSQNAINNSAQSGTPTGTSSQMLLSDYQRSLLRTSVRQFDARLKKYYYRVAMLSFSDRQIIIDNIINSTALTPKDVECAVRLIDEYASQINLLPASPAVGGTPKPTAPVVQSMSKAITTMPTTITVPRTAAIQQQIQKQNPILHNSLSQIPKMDKDNSLMGYQIASSVSTRSSIMSTTTTSAKNTSLPNVTTTTNTAIASLKAAQDSPRIFYTKPPMQTSTPIATPTSSGSSTPLSGVKTVSLRSNPRLGREMTIRQIPSKLVTVSSTTVTSTPPTTRRCLPQLTRNPYMTTNNTTPASSIANASSVSDTITTRSAVTISTAPKRMTRASAAAKVIVITQNNEDDNASLDECILPDGHENTEIKRERVDDDFVGGN